MNSKQHSEFVSLDPATLLDDQETISLYLNTVLEQGNAAQFAAALGMVARAEGMTQIAKNAGITRQSLYQSLSLEGNPTTETLLSVIRTLGLKLQVVRAEGLL